MDISIGVNVIDIWKEGVFKLMLLFNLKMFWEMLHNFAIISRF